MERTRSKPHRKPTQLGRGFCTGQVRTRQERSDLAQARLIEVMHGMNHHAK